MTDKNRGDNFYRDRRMSMSDVESGEIRFTDDVRQPNSSVTNKHHPAYKTSQADKIHVLVQTKDEVKINTAKKYPQKSQISLAKISLNALNITKEMILRNI